MKLETVEEREKRLNSLVIGNQEFDDMTYYPPLSSWIRLLPPIEMVGIKFYPDYTINNAFQWAMLKELREIKELLKNKEDKT